MSEPYMGGYCENDCDRVALRAEVERLRAENADLWLVADGWGVDDPSRESFEAWKRTHPGE